MLRLSGLLAGLVGLVALGCGTAQAQSFGISVYAGDRYAPYYSYGPGYYDPYYYSPTYTYRYRSYSYAPRADRGYRYVSRTNRGYGYRTYGYRSYGYGPRVYGYSAYGYGPRVYGYAATPRSYGYAAAAPATRPRENGSCGLYHYWNGQTCVDARDVPPDLTD